MSAGGVVPILLEIRRPGWDEGFTRLPRPLDGERARQREEGVCQQGRAPAAALRGEQRVQPLPTQCGAAARSASE